jgi:hypothetical protein
MGLNLEYNLDWWFVVLLGVGFGTAKACIDIKNEHSMTIILLIFISIR